MRLEGKIGLVTAAASGMGRAGAIRFAREGAAVGVVDIDQAGVDAYAAAGVDRLILRVRPELDATGLARFAAEAGRALGLSG